LSASRRLGASSFCQDCKTPRAQSTSVTIRIARTAIVDTVFSSRVSSTPARRDPVHVFTRSQRHERCVTSHPSKRPRRVPSPSPTSRSIRAQARRRPSPCRVHPAIEREEIHSIPRPNASRVASSRRRPRPRKSNHALAYVDAFHAPCSRSRARIGSSVFCVQRASTRASARGLP